MVYHIEIDPVSSVFLFLRSKISDEHWNGGEERNVKQRGYIVQELVDTGGYVAQLQLVVDIFIEPLRQEKIINNIDINEQFLNWEPILGLHKQLLEQLETGSDSLGDTKVGQIFINYSSFFKMYMQYLSNFEIALTRELNLCAKIESF